MEDKMPVANVKSKWVDGNLVFYSESTGKYLLPIKTDTPEKIYVDPDGDDTNGDGSLFSPVATLTAALALVTTSRKKIVIRSGEYDEAAALVWPDVDDVVLTCPDGVATISSSASTTHVLGVDPAAAAGTWTFTLENICISHANGQIGLQVDNSAVGKRINMILKNFSSEAETTTDASIDINRSGAAGNAIRVYADGSGQVIEGLVTVITESTDDRFRFKGYRLTGGLTVVGAIASEVTLISCGVKTSGLTVDGANKLTNIHCWYETDANPNVYTVFNDAYATY
jgi:hypothetical protein